MAANALGPLGGTGLAGTSVDAGPGGMLAPAFSVRVADKPLGDGVDALITSVDCETADGVAEVCHVTLLNPDFVVTDKQVFQPNNEITIRMGYNPNSLRRMGRYVIRKVEPTYPKGDDSPYLTVTGYSRDNAMMDHSPPPKKVNQGTGLKNKAPKKRVFVNHTFSEIVEVKAKEYGFVPDVDKTTKATDRVQPSGMTDYELVRGLANLLGWLFWVDADDAGRWTLHFKDPEKNTSTQDKRFTFRYRDGDLSTLLEFEPQLLMSGFSTQVTAVVQNTLTGKPMTVTYDETLEAPDSKFDGDVQAEVDGPQKSGASVKLFFKDFAFDLVAGKRFKTEGEVRDWLRAWFRKQRENFVLASGTTVGIETLAARQIHRVEGVGKAFSGDYYFSRVRHVMDSENGYLCDFSARKVVPA